jgi:plastocyanin
MRGRTSGLFAALGIAAAACGSSSSSAAPAPEGPGFFITISNMSFAPLDLHAPPGATVTVLDRDGIAHSVTSEASPNAFTRGSVGGVSFDTGQFTGTKTFALPSTASSGTVIPYYCTVHAGTMTTPNGTITIDPAALPTTAPGSGGAGAGGGGGGGGY